MIDKLAKLSDETLFALKAAIDQACIARKMRLLVPGREATFITSPGAKTVRIKITGRGPKNVIGYTILEDGRHDTKQRWRVSPDFLMPYFPPTAGPSKDRPSSTPDQVF